TDHCLLTSSERICNDVSIGADSKLAIGAVDGWVIRVQRANRHDVTIAEIDDRERLAMLFICVKGTSSVIIHKCKFAKPPNLAEDMVVTRHRIPYSEDTG